MTKLQVSPRPQRARHETLHLKLPAADGLAGAALLALENEQLSASKAERLRSLACTQLTEEGILAAARESWHQHGKIPTMRSEEHTSELQSH